ncbi:hypothetical protein [Nonomuraea sp. NPDC005501]|uniref:hypothetical protein n=1 Tax=Nonomuraea sp. NPDC005501 TaxID=3156884 RepID=UPI0033A002A5
MSTAVLFTALVDDAGLFPPTSLHMSDALARHRRDQEHGGQVLTHRFLCPASRLDALRREEFVPRRIGLIVDTPEIPPFEDLPVDIVEVPMPPDSSVAATALGVAGRLPRGVRLFVEVPAHRVGTDVPEGVGLKVRCGGATSDAFPPVEHLAVFIRSCVEQEIPFKATAGLHHAVRHFDPSLGTDRHGFLNLVLAVCEAVERRDPVPALRATDAARLVALARQVDPETAKHARELLVSYGSCNTAAPLGDLRELGLIPE